MSFRRNAVLAILAAAGLGGALSAGPLTPPSGPIAPSYKTLTDVEPRIAINATNTPGDSSCLYKITYPGSYYFTDNVTGVAGKTTVTIANPLQVGVTIDLNGFRLTGGTTAINTSLSQLAVTVKNGTINATNNTAIDLGTVEGARIEGVTIYSPGGNGIATGDLASVTDCRVSGPGANGIFVGNGSIVKDCSVSDASTQGFWCNSSCEISGCIAKNCTQNGFHLIGEQTTASHCAAYFCSNYGFYTGSQCRIENCTASHAGYCGFFLGGENTIRECLATTCTTQGIVASGGACTIVNNQCSSNGTGGSAAIWLQGNVCHVEGNTLTGNGYGIYVDSQWNLIIRNRVSSSSVANYHIAAGNEFGPIVSTGTSTALVNGLSAPGTLGTTDPNANFSY